MKQAWRDAEKGEIGAVGVWGSPTQPLGSLEGTWSFCRYLCDPQVQMRAEFERELSLRNIIEKLPFEVVPGDTIPPFPPNKSMGIGDSSCRSKPQRGSTTLREGAM